MEFSEQKLKDALEALAVPHDLIEIDPDFADTVAFCEKYDYPLERSCNTLMVASKKEPKRHAVCVVLATTRLDVNRRVKKLLGVSKVSFAPSEEMKAVLGMQVGGVTPFALPADLPLYVDARIMALEWIILGGGGRRLKVKTSPEVFSKLGAEIVSDLALAVEEKPQN